MSTEYPQLTRLSEIFVQQYERYLPTAFDESLTLLEKINKMIEFMNQTGTLVNSAVDVIEEAIARQDLDITELRSEFETLVNDTLPANLETVLDAWYSSGKLADIINTDVFNMKADKTELDTQKTRLQELGFNIQNNSHLVVSGDWTAAIQNALDNYDHVIIPVGVFNVSGTLNITRFGQRISSPSQNYAAGTINYTGTGTCFNVQVSTSYLLLDNVHIKRIPSVPTHYYDTGTTCIDTTAGVSVVMNGCWLEGFETLVKSLYNSFYNKFIDCRFNKAKTVLSQFSDNNLEIKGCRFMQFHEATVTNGGNGAQIIEKCSFEIFNGSIVRRTGVEKGLVIFQDNYVETYDQTDLPTNFPTMSATGSLFGKFGGNTLFTGYYRNLIIKNNELQIGGVFRLATITSIDYLESVGNNIHLYDAGNNLDRLYSITGTMVSYKINDILGYSVGGDGGYTRPYTPMQMTLVNPYNDSYYYDCVANKIMQDTTKMYTPSLQNGWTGSATIGYDVPKIRYTRDGLIVSGAIDGTASTGNIIFTLPVDKRPLVQSTAKSFVSLLTGADFGIGERIRLRYLYSTGELRLEGSPTSKLNINLDGLFIPTQI